MQTAHILIIGYTDNVPIGPELQQQGIGSNQQLSLKRAKTVMQYMISQGVNPNLLTAEGRGDADPVSSNDTAQGIPTTKRLPDMSDLVVIAFPSEAKAEEVRQKLLDMQKDYLIELGDAVIAIKQPNGRVKLNQIFHPTAAGAASGSFWGLLIGFIFMVPVAGVALGAAVGALGGAFADVGINDRFMKDAAQTLH
jgi:Protein of unknown function (DUF1269)/OmpA family